MTTPCTETARLASMDNKLDRVRASVGEAPDESVGRQGSGISRTLVELKALVHSHLETSTTALALAKAEADARVKTVKIIATASAGVISTIAGVIVAIYTAG